MVNQEAKLPCRKLENSLEYYATVTVSVCAILFFFWTVCSHVATIFDIPWMYLIRTIKFLSPLLLLSSWLLSRRFATIYSQGLAINDTINNLPNLKSLAALFSAALLIALSDSYIVKFVVVTIGLAVIITSSGKAEYGQTKHNIKHCYSFKKQDFLALIFIILIALSVVLFSHRTDLDDASFIQIAAQTLAHPDRPPLSFDSSLGYVIEPFRFSPYRISSYETLVAFAHNLCGIDIYYIYYIILPAITATLTLLTAFIFSRWFFSTNTLAIAATAVFLVIILVWGETFIAYGSRVFLRLFQGKALIIALTTPFSIVVGLVLVNRPSYFVAGVLAVANVCAIGVSSSGLVMTIFTSIIILVLAINRDFKKMARTWIMVSLAMIYPILLALWLRIENKSAVSMSDIGTYLPINASLGMDLRESILMTGLLLGFSLFIFARNKSYSLMVLAVYAFVLNPWLSEIVSQEVSRNMSWRLAWAAPIPLLLSVALIAGISIRAPVESINGRIISVGLNAAAVALLLSFVFSYKWVYSSENNVSWRLPAAKLPREFYIATQISDRIRALKISGQVLAHRQIAAWLPLTLPNVKLVMAGHTFPVQLQTTLPKREFDSRIALYDAVNNGAPNPSEFLRYVLDLDVDLIVIPTDMEPSLRAVFFYSAERNISLSKIESFPAYDLYQVIRGR